MSTGTGTGFDGCLATGGGTGAIRFVRYAYPPNVLGYCGPADTAELVEAADAGDVRSVTALAARFEGALPYLRLIAACNGIGDLFDEKVVEAYWLGGPLLGRVPPALLATSLDERFAPQAGARLPLLAEAALAGGVAHHSFHVFAVSPFVGLLRSGRQQPALTVLDRCRIRWGTIVSVDATSAVVRSRPLVLDHDRLALGNARLEIAGWRPERGAHAGPAPAPLRPGDVVSLHWDWICERLDQLALARLVAASSRNLAVVDATCRSAAARAVEASGG